MEFEITLRPSTAADLRPHYELFRAAMRDYEEAAHGAWDEHARWAEFQAGFPIGRARIIEVDGERVGAIDAERRADAWHLNNFEIAPGWQSRGIGTRLIRDLVARAADEGLPVALDVLKVNPRARALYERLGFERVGETATHIQMRTRDPVVALSTRPP
jgi:ribosomal protein S18 acetylase RimI-like enzyme